MKESGRSGGPRKGAFNSQFVEFIELFATIGTDEKIFPKRCNTCGKIYQSFPEYIHRTEPEDHCLEDYRELREGFGTMQYRKCYCGSTLTIIFAEDDYPTLDRFWEMIGREAKERGTTIRDVVREFREECNRYVVEHSSPKRT